MNPKCVAQLNAARLADGRNPLSGGQIDAIEGRMREAMRRLARTDKDWQTYTTDQRMLLAAQEAAADIAAEAARKVRNAQLQVLKTAETETRITDAMARQNWSRARALVEDMQRSRSYIDGIKLDAARRLISLIEASASGQDASLGRRALMFLFDAQNPAMTRDLALEVFAQGNAGTGNKLAVLAAKAWLEVIEPLRLRFNAGGGDVGRLDYGYLPNSHDPVRVLRIGRDRWAQETLGLLDRRRYLREDGTQMNDAEVLDVLRSAWETIVTDGANKHAPGAFKGTGARANRGMESRQIHFKDGEAYLTYLQRFGTGSMYDAMIGHIGGLSRDIGLVERYGPNPESQMRVQFDLAKPAEGERGLVGQAADLFADPRAQWRVLSGAAAIPDRPLVAQIFMHSRNIQVFGKLAGAVLSSITDLGTYAVTAGYNRLPYFQALTNIPRAARRETIDFMNAHGMIAESMISDLNRWSGENIAQNWSGKLASATMRPSLMNLWTDTMRRGFQLTHMAAIGRMRAQAWDQLTEYDRWRLSSKDITQADWDLIRAATPEQFRGMDMVTPDAIYATGDPRAGEVVAKYLGMLMDESEIAVLNPDLTTRAIVTGGGKQAGTAEGELFRAVAQFKSFPIAMISRHWRRMLDTPQSMDGAPVVANRLAYAGAMMVSLTALGALAFQTKQIVQGKDPVDMTTGKFWTRAFAQGGGLGFVGDMLLTDTTDALSPQDALGRTVLGPTWGSLVDLYELTKGNVDEAMAGKDTKAGAEAIRFARSHAPLINLWYARTALDQAALHAVQENLSPGYLQRIRAKARKDWGQSYWWEPGGDFEPERAPDLSAAFGE
jgi:hypothetical protein